MADISQEAVARQDDPGFDRIESAKRYEAGKEFLTSDANTWLLLNQLLDLNDRPLFTTRDVRLGFAIRGIWEGDRVVVFNGAPTPHVIHKVGEKRRGEQQEPCMVHEEDLAS